ncbi:hypothetical protein [Gordonia hydrophobica]|uniref:Uncharacterized protein n=1 Tax=Gordonia hydrophobica TaxID=40516 RepID=A0ABZ2U0X3_9ACTN|nr:hypothetical protein [Gordonia hydrophobica]MBM7367542.1 hypothetical protein [Gordonia hydrophobica]
MSGHWPGDPAAAWADAVRSSDRYDRLTAPPRIDSADAASLADWNEDRHSLRSLLPMFAIVSAAAGVVLISGLLLGILPLSGPDATKEVVQWVSGISLLITSAVLAAREVVTRRRTESPQTIPVQIVLCQLHPTRFEIHDGDGYRETCIAIGAGIPDAQAARVFTAFQVWLGRLYEDHDAESRARNELWRPSGANVFTSEEIFGPQAAGGYLVRRPALAADGWGALITRRRPATLAGQLRFADVLQWTGNGWRP